MDPNGLAGGLQQSQREMKPTDFADHIFIADYENRLDVSSQGQINGASERRWPFDVEKQLDPRWIQLSERGRRRRWHPTAITPLCEFAICIFQKALHRKA